MASKFIDWRKFWKEFETWIDNRPEYLFTEWTIQIRKITQMLKKYFPNLDYRKLWKDYNNKLGEHEICKTCTVCYSQYDVYVDWAIRKRWIREIVEKQVS
jgi:hypothetical protein